MPILTYRSANPLKDGRQSENALMIQRGVTRYFLDNDIAMFPEFTLANNMRADLVGLDNKGLVIIVEIKSSVEDFKADHKWNEYCKFCDRFYFASHKNVPENIFPRQEGFIVADNYGAEIIRPASEHRIAAPTRKALTLKIARAATRRIERVMQFAVSAGIEFPEAFS